MDASSRRPRASKENCSIPGEIVERSSFRSGNPWNGMNPVLRADVLSLEAAGLAVGRTPAVVGFLQDSMGLGHS
jgi:hypothetical protein